MIWIAPPVCDRVSGKPESDRGDIMEIAILIYDRLTALDAIEPYEVLRSAPGATVKFAARERGPRPPR